MAKLTKLLGLMKLRDAYPKINENFDALNNELAAQNDRIDNIVADAGSSNTEIVDARHSGPNDITYPTLTDRINVAEENIRNNIVPKRYIFGGQLAKLKYSLSNPLEQYTGIVMIGDSITWGRTLPENGITDPRDGTLSDPRDVFASPSYVNLFKRYIGAEYAFNADPVLSNWFASSSGESTVVYTVRHILYPKGGDFNITSVGTSQNLTEVQTAGSLTGFQMQLANGDPSGSSYQQISFPFTGDSFTLSFGCVDADASYYDLIVDGVKRGTFSTHAGDGFVNGTNDNRRTHTFPYVRNKTIEIRTNRNGETGVRRLRVEAIIIDKKIRITNQGINGATSRSYKLYNLAGNSFGDGEAVGIQDNFVFCQLGTNDRIIRTDVPKGSNQFLYNLQALLDVVTPLSDVILMCSNPAVNEDPSTYSFNMQEVRNVIYRTAKENNLDMVDNYAVFKGLDLSIYTADGLHPNRLGHHLIAQNIINSLETA